MALSELILKKINKVFAPNTWVELRFRTYDIVLKTDDQGNAIQMFIGKIKEDGMVKGERYSRKIVRDKDGAIMKEHWDRKGKTH